MSAEADAGSITAGEGDQLAGRYVVGRLLGAGATGEVRAGWDRRLDRAVAIKLLRADRAWEPAVRRRFAEEARAAARLSHPNVVAVFDTGDPDGDGPPHIVMERLPGDTLRSAIDAGPLPVAAVRSLAAEMLSALSAGARAGLVHCDIKPGNILATGDGHWKLGDFGVARTVVPFEAGAAPVADPEDTMAGLVMGTPAYLPPERLYGEPATESADLFSLGVVLYEALTGRRPFQTTDSFPWSSALSGVPAPPVRSLCPTVDRSLARVIDRAVRLDAAKRYRSAGEMAADLSGAHARPLAVPTSRTSRAAAFPSATTATGTSGPASAATAADLEATAGVICANAVPPPAPAGVSRASVADPAETAAATVAPIRSLRPSGRSGRSSVLSSRMGSGAFRRALAGSVAGAAALTASLLLVTAGGSAHAGQPGGAAGASASSGSVPAATTGGRQSASTAPSPAMLAASSAGPGPVSTTAPAVTPATVAASSGAAAAPKPNHQPHGPGQPAGPAPAPATPGHHGGGGAASRTAGPQH